MTALSKWIEDLGLVVPGTNDLILGAGELGDDDSETLAEVIRETYALDTASEVVFMRCEGSDRLIPVVDGVPILVGNMTVEQRGLFDSLPEELVHEITVYERVAVDEISWIEKTALPTASDSVSDGLAAASRTFPDPFEFWLDAVYDSRSQYYAYSYLVPVQGASVLQLGGKGMHAVKMLRAGAESAFLITPVLGEAMYALELAKQFGFDGKLKCVVGFGESMPFQDSNFDCVYAGGTLHHTDIEQAIPEIRRVLVDGGRFAASEPWKAPGYTLGTKLFGKRERDIRCKPIDAQRMSGVNAPLMGLKIKTFGTLTRYPLIALSKLKVRPGLTIVWHIFRIDEFVTRLIPGAGRFGGSIAVTMTKSGTSADQATGVVPTNNAV